MGQIDRSFVIAGLLWLVLGMALGIYMGIANDNRYVTVHVAMLLGGFVVLTLYGLIYRLWPALNAGALAKAQFWLGVLGALLLVIGAFMIVNNGGIALAAVGSLMALAAAMLMVWMFATRTR